MITQNQILRTIRAAPARLSHTIQAHPALGRTALSRRVCEVFNFRDARGQLQHAGCLKALKTLESEGRLALPASRRTATGPLVRLLDHPVPEARAVPRSLRHLRGLEVIPVTCPEQRAVWSTLMHAEHPRGVTRFAGAQMRYLVCSDHGILGAVGFAAAALYLRARDRWMGWTDAQRQQHLFRVVGLSRFLIRPGVRCAHLASHVLGTVLRRLPADFARRYGYRPWVVETFVGPGQQGTCFRAAGFKYAGQTTGRGRHARTLACHKSRKSVFVYELDRRWRRTLGVPAVSLYPKRAVGAGLDSAGWVQQEFGEAPLGTRPAWSRAWAFCPGCRGCR